VLPAAGPRSPRHPPPPAQQKAPLAAATMRQRHPGSLLVALALGACAPVTPAAGTGPAAPLPPSPPAAPAAAAPPPAELAARPPLPVPPPRDRPDESLAPQHLVGLTEDDLRQLIGAPAAVREEPPAVLWSYSSAGCALNVFFYMDLASKTFRALTYELKPKEPNGLAGGACLASLRPSSHDAPKLP